MIELDARYLLQEDESAILLLKGDLSLDLESDQGAHSVLTILHERFSGGVMEIDRDDVFCLQLRLIAGESLTFLVRRAGRMVATLVTEVETENATRILLRPRGGFDLILHQQRCEDASEVSVMGALHASISTQLQRLAPVPTER